MHKINNLTPQFHRNILRRYEKHTDFQKSTKYFGFFSREKNLAQIQNHSTWLKELNDQFFRCLRIATICKGILFIVFLLVQTIYMHVCFKTNVRILADI
jgi:hypothetical protein